MVNVSPLMGHHNKRMTAAEGLKAGKNGFHTF